MWRKPWCFHAASALSWISSHTRQRVVHKLSWSNMLPEPKDWHPASLHPRLAWQSFPKSASAPASPLTGTSFGVGGVGGGGGIWGGMRCSDRFAREVFAPSLAGLIESTAIFQLLIKSEGSGSAGITWEQIDFGPVLSILFGCLYENAIFAIFLFIVF